MNILNRRNFLSLAGLAASQLFPSPFAALAAPQKRKVKITDVKCMIVRGTWDWNLIKIETDSGLYGIGEAYWGPGVKDVILKILKPQLLGEDPLNVDKLYTKMLMRNAGAGAIAGVTVDGRQRHRNRPVGSGRPHPRNARLQSARRPLPRPRPLLPHPAAPPKATSTIPPPGAISSARPRREVGLDRLQISGRRRPHRARPPTSANPATTPTSATSRSSDIGASSADGDRARRARPRRRLRHRLPLALRHPRRHPTWPRPRTRPAHVARRSRAARQPRRHGARHAANQRPHLHR